MTHRSSPAALAALTVALYFALSGAPAALAGEAVSLDQALADAATQGKPLLIDFHTQW
jgi:hypothetical protein